MQRVNDGCSKVLLSIGVYVTRHCFAFAFLLSSYPTFPLRCIIKIVVVVVIVIVVMAYPSLKNALLSFQSLPGVNNNISSIHCSELLHSACFHHDAAFICHATFEIHVMQLFIFTLLAFVRSFAPRLLSDCKDEGHFWAVDKPVVFHDDDEGRMSEQ